jgi:serine O-acetyltransferase
MSGTEVWLSVVHEARRAMAADQAYAQMLAKAVLDQPGLEQAVAHQIAARLGGPDMSAAFEAAALEAFAADPSIIAAAADDLEAIVRNDLASPGFLPVLLNFKGYLAVQAWRVSHWLWQQAREDVALLIQSASSSRLQVSIHPSAELGTRVFLDHATGIVIGPFATICDDVTILQNVTIGRQRDAFDRAPRIGRGVLLGNGATVLGPVTIGDFAKVGAGAMIDRDVPAGCTAVGDPMRLTNCPPPGRFAA